MTHYAQRSLYTLCGDVALTGPWYEALSGR